MTGYMPAELQLMTTTELLALLQTTHLTSRELRAIRAEINSRRI